VNCLLATKRVKNEREPGQQPQQLSRSQLKAERGATQRRRKLRKERIAEYHTTN